MTTPTAIPRLGPRSPSRGGARACVVAVGSGKGGVGTSTVAALLASTMASDGHRVLLVDAGHRLGAMHHLLGVEPAGTLGQLRGGRREAGDLLVPVAERLALFPGSIEEADVGSAERALLMRRVEALYDDYELVVVDAGSSAQSLVAACAARSSRLLAVTASDRIALVATFAVIKLLHERAPSVRVDIVANRVEAEVADRLHDHLNAASVRFLSRTIPFAGAIPDDPDFASALAAGLGTDAAARGSNAAQAARAIGELLLDDSARESSPIHRFLRKG
jgi:flagellar biosynthesis protein FlhG